MRERISDHSHDIRESMVSSGTKQVERADHLIDIPRVRSQFKFDGNELQLSKV